MASTPRAWYYLARDATNPGDAFDCVSQMVADLIYHHDTLALRVLHNQIPAAKELWACGQSLDRAERKAEHDHDISRCKKGAIKS